MAKEYFCAYHSYAEALTAYGDAEKGRLFMACLTYSKTGVEPQLSGNERFIWPMLKQNIDRDAGRYDDRCSKNKENVSKRYQKSTNVYERIQSYTNGYETYQEEEKDKEEYKDKYKDKEDIKETLSNESAKKTAPRFSPPTLEEVKAYIDEKGYATDAEQWMAYYESNGWKVGKNSMKDWKAAVRTWGARDGMKKSPTLATPPTETAKSDLARMMSLHDRLKGGNDEA